MRDYSRGIWFQLKGQGRLLWENDSYTQIDHGKAKKLNIGYWNNPDNSNNRKPLSSQRLEEQRVLSEPRDQVHPVEARTIVRLPYRGWGQSGDIATARDVTWGRRSGHEKGEIPWFLHHTLLHFSTSASCCLNPEGKVLIWNARIQIPRQSASPWCRAKKEHNKYKEWIWRQAQD